VAEKQLHHCHAVDCWERVPPKFLMCARHWYKVPAVLRRRVWQTYRIGQEIDKQPSEAWCLAAREAINFVAQAEGKPKVPEAEQFFKTLFLNNRSKAEIPEPPQT
jgi:hypothetical protein